VLLYQTCVPLSLILDNGPSSSEYGAAGASSCTQCSFCKTGSYSGIYIEPLSFEDIDKSITLRKQATPSPTSSVSSSSGPSCSAIPKDADSDQNDQDKEVRAAYVVYSQLKPVIASGLRDAEGSGRTGRWTDGEVEYVDHIVTLFDQGELPLPEDTKLGNFLGDILLCRTSRLTKKMKKAKLSARTFKLKSSNSGQFSTAKDYEFLSMLQEEFVRSMPEEYTQVEIRFNLVRKWRTYFLELCLQAGYSRVVAGDWIASLDEFDKRASLVKEQVRALDRRRMSNESFQNESSKQSTMSPTYLRENLLTTSTRLEMSHESDASFNTFQSQSHKRAFEMPDPQVGLDLDYTEQPTPKRPRSGSEELDTLIDFMEDSVDIIDEDSSTTTGQDSSEELVKVYNSSTMPRSLSSAPKTFSDVVASLMESYDLPFDYADVWVPSLAKTKTIRLLSAGHATRRDQLNAAALEDFGEYSQKFSFDAGSGLPGRVYSTGQARWEFKVCDSDPCFFLRAAGAKAYGIKTAVGIPFTTAGLGKIVVVFYSRQELNEDSSIATMCLAGLSRYSPSPKWKLVIDKGAQQEDSSTTSSLQESTYFSSFSGALLPPTAIGSNPSSVGAAEDSTPPTMSAQNSETVQSMISLFGNQLSARPEPSGNNVISQMLNLRLFLLTPSSRLSQEDMGLVSILKSSFDCYSKDSKRSQSDVALILTREWIALQSARNPASPSYMKTYRRYVLDPVLTQLSTPNGLVRPALTTIHKTLQTSEPAESSILVYDHSKIPLIVDVNDLPKKDTFDMDYCDHDPIKTTIFEPRYRTVSLLSMAHNSAPIRASKRENIASRVSSTNTVFPFEVFSTH
jgi:hypothetical protein